MSDHLGPMTFGKKQEQVFLGRDIYEDRNYSEEVANQIDLEVRTIIDGCYTRAKDLLVRNRETLEAVVAELLEKENLDSDDLNRIIAATAEAEKASDVQATPTPATTDVAG